MLTAAVLFMRCTAGENVRIVEIASPAGAGAAEPFLAASKNGVLLSWLEPVPNSDRTALRFARFGGDNDEALVTWLEQSGEIRARYVERTSAMQPSMKIAQSSAGRDVYFAWTGQKRVHVARLNH